VVAEIKVISSRYYHLAKEGTWILLGQVSAVLGALVLVRVLTEYLDPCSTGASRWALRLLAWWTRLRWVG
jgi:hypothetical protein